MQVSRLSSINFNNIIGITPKHSKNEFTGQMDSSTSCLKYSADNVKANFMPSFGLGRKVGKVGIIDNETGLLVQADIKKTKVGSYVTFDVGLGRKKLGYLTMNLDTIYPVPEHVLTFPTDNIPKVTNLRTIEGNKYSGIGTALIQTAVKESVKNKSYGNLWLSSEKGYEKYLSSYRSDENPIPFYYKMGFRSPDREIDEHIQRCLENHNYYDLPEITTLILCQEERSRLTDEVGDSSYSNKALAAAI